MHAPKYERTEPVLCLGYQHVYSDVYRCLTKHGNVIHTKQVVWDFEDPLGVWLSNDSEPNQHKVEESELYGSIGLELFKDKNGKARTEFGSANAILKAVPHRLHRSNNTIRPRPYIYARARERDGVSVQEALHSKYLNEVGLPVRYTVADLRYDLKCGWLALFMPTHGRAKRMMTPLTTPLLQVRRRVERTRPSAMAPRPRPQSGARARHQGVERARHNLQQRRPSR